VTLVRFAVSAWLVVLVGLAMCMGVASCGYDDRSFDGIVFACDSAHPCPNGGACVDGKCPTMSTGMQGVACLSQQCSPGMGCCQEVINPPYCVPLGGCDSGAQQELQCDGKEDCTGGRNCCFDGGGTRCEAGNCGGPSFLICSGTADCPVGQPFCCTFPGLEVPLKHCQPFSCQ
jgi:hypothetical protein